MIDYIIVGFGLAGLSFVEQLEDNNKSYLVFENNSQRSSRVAGGLYNPVILKRFTPAWSANEQLQKALPFYRRIETRLQESFVKDLSIVRRFNSIEEQNTWFEACDKPILDQFLLPELIENTNKALDVPYQFGRVKHTGKVDLKKMLSLYLNYIDQKKRLANESFNHDQLLVKPDFVEYKNVKAKHIIFAEGFGVKNNPFFNYLPLVGNKGEYIIIKSEALKLEEAVKSSVFIIPLGNDTYKVGATYNNQDKSPGTTEQAKKEIENKLDSFLKAKYEVIDQVAGIRPTVRDRRPLVGTHPEFINIHILNGLGSRGILIGPTVAQHLYNLIENKKPLNKEYNIKRFEKL
ncbi:FAD-dependent oxidoreductase [Aquimarina gracilis]|uniref:FAD-dependent oxidoreductase n=1 Tax=Aquimarina gracilis TaxID=874422 RepID=A0ABU5ZTD1_9FLAO|nr:FAD-dependent oxidoreductase [Aquimarina gracilis]MEB3345312.1 FAD-dependent oxidoreductase [Aquimarina gracilis]